MASVEVILEEVKPPVKGVVLTLTPAEALIVGALTGASSDGDAYGVYNALNTAGFGYDNLGFTDATRRATKGIVNA